jgi:phosphate/sulfate permease
MMVTTHAVVGATVGVGVGLVAPEYATVAATAGFAGGIVPDLDLAVGDHRRTLHFPVYYWLVALPAAAVATAVPGPATVGLAVALLAAAVHSASDALGAGEELRPWEATTDDAVYSHWHGRWLRARRWVRYDGAPADLALTAAFALPPVAAVGGRVGALCVGCLAVGGGYALIRKRVPDLAERYLPERYLP